MSEIFARLRERFRWWRAKRFGERPVCGVEDCDHDAVHYLSPEGYRCLMCYIRGQPYRGIGFVRDLEPADYFGDTDD